MTSRDLLWLLLRRWYLVILGMLLTLAVVWPATHRPGVFWTQVDVILLPPTGEFFPNQLEDPHYSLSALAGVVVSDYNGQHKPTLMASSATTLYGEGRSSGTEVRMPNAGNQWMPLYPTATIDVQAVDASPEAVTERLVTVTGELQDLLAQRQDELGISSMMRATLIISPSHPSIYYVTGSRMRALGAGGIVGMGFTVTGVYWLERILLDRRKNTLSGRRGQRSYDYDRESSTGRQQSARAPRRNRRLEASVRQEPPVAAGTTES